MVFPFPVPVKNTRLLYLPVGKSSSKSVGLSGDPVMGSAAVIVVSFTPVSGVPFFSFNWLFPKRFLYISSILILIAKYFIVRFCYDFY